MMHIRGHNYRLFVTCRIRLTKDLYKVVNMPFRDKLIGKYSAVPTEAFYAHLLPCISFYGIKALKREITG